MFPFNNICCIFKQYTLGVHISKQKNSDGGLEPIPATSGWTSQLQRTYRYTTTHSHTYGPSTTQWSSSTATIHLSSSAFPPQKVAGGLEPILVSQGKGGVQEPLPVWVG